MYQQIVRKNFLCREKSTHDPHAVKEGIQTPTGDVFVGYDVWRLLDYMDYPYLPATVSCCIFVKMMWRKPYQV